MNADLVLEGKSIVLQPLEAGHLEALFAVLDTPEVWQYTWRAVPTLAEMRAMLDTAIENRGKGTHLPFVILHRDTNRIVGTTRIGDLDPVNRNAEIGWTWLSPDFWRTSVNTECKYLLLRHCFESLKVIRVQFSVSGSNLRSQRAIERIGAVKEGVFRKHRIKPDGTVHDNVYYSILDAEWPLVEANLLHFLNKSYRP